MILYLIIHGALYHCLWASHSTKMYREEAFRFEYKWGFSNASGLVAWCASVVIAITAIPAFRRNFYWVRPPPPPDTPDVLIHSITDTCADSHVFAASVRRSTRPHHLPTLPRRCHTKYPGQTLGTPDGRRATPPSYIAVPPLLRATDL